MRISYLLVDGIYDATRAHLSPKAYDISRTFHCLARLGVIPAQGQLPGRTREVAHEVLYMLGYCKTFDVAASLDFERYTVRDIFRPMLKCVEGYNADRIVELPRH